LKSTSQRTFISAISDLGDASKIAMMKAKVVHRKPELTTINNVARMIEANLALIKRRHSVE